MQKDRNRVQKKEEHRANKKKQPASGIFTPLSVSLGASGLISPRRQNLTANNTLLCRMKYGHGKTKRTE